MKTVIKKLHDSMNNLTIGFHSLFGHVFNPKSCQIMMFFKYLKYKLIKKKYLRDYHVKQGYIFKHDRGKHFFFHINYNYDYKTI